jgi:hypothetical protein
MISHTVTIFQLHGQPQEDYFFMECWKWIDIHTLGEHDRFETEQLSGNGLALLEKLEDAGDGPVVPAKLKQRLAEADISKVKQHQFDTSDGRPMDELLWDLRTIQVIISLSHRRSVNLDHEPEWNNRVHAKVLELAQDLPPEVPRTWAVLSEQGDVPLLLRSIMAHTDVSP